MKFYNKLILVSNLKDLCNLLQQDIYNICLPFTIFPIYTNKLAIKHHNYGDYNSIRIWETKVLFNYWHNNFKSKYFIGALDYKINNDNIKIEYFNIADDESYSYNKLNSNDSSELTQALIDLIINKAKEGNKRKIVIDVHNNLRLYHKYYKYNYFDITNHKCLDNSTWIEIEFILK